MRWADAAQRSLQPNPKQVPPAKRPGMSGKPIVKYKSSIAGEQWLQQRGVAQIPFHIPRSSYHRLQQAEASAMKSSRFSGRGCGGDMRCRLPSHIKSVATQQHYAATISRWNTWDRLQLPRHRVRLYHWALPQHQKVWSFQPLRNTFTNGISTAGIHLTNPILGNATTLRWHLMRSRRKSVRLV